MLMAGFGSPCTSAQDVAPAKGQRRSGGIINDGGIPARPLPFDPRGRHADMNGDPLPDRIRFRAGGTRLRHSGPVTCIAWAPDGKRLISGAHDGTVAVWDSATGRQVMQLVHGDKSFEFVTCLAVSADGKLLASGGSTSVVLWDLDSGESLDRYVPAAKASGGNGCRSLCFTSRGKRLASGWGSDTVRLWDMGTARGMPAPIEFTSLGAQAALSADGSALAVGCKSDLHIIDAATGRPRRAPLTLDIEEICGLAYSPDGTTIAVKGTRHEVSICDPATGRQKHVLEVDDQVEAGENGFPDTAVAFSPDGRRVAATGFMTVSQWDLATGKRVLSFDGHDEHRIHGGIIHGVAFSPDGRRLATACRDETIRIWDAATGREQRPFFEFSGKPLAAVIAPNGTWIAVGIEGDARIHRFDLETGKALDPIRADASGTRRLAVSPDGRLLASTAAAADDRIVLWDAASGRKVRTLVGKGGKSSYSVLFSPRGDRLATWSQADGLVFWEVATGRELARVRAAGPRNNAVMIPFSRSVVFDPDGELVAAICYDMEEGVERTPILLCKVDGSVVREFDSGLVGDLVEAKPTDTFPGRPEPQHDFDTHYNRLWFMPDGKTLIAGGFDTTSYFEVATGKWLRSNGDGGFVNLTPDGKTLMVSAAGEWMGTEREDVRVFDIATGKSRPGLFGHGKQISAFAFSADGRRAVTAGEDRTVIVWDMTAVANVDAQMNAARTCRQADCGKPDD